MNIKARITKGSTNIGISDLEEDTHHTKNYAQLTFLKYYTPHNKKCNSIITLL